VEPIPPAEAPAVESIPPAEAPAVEPIPPTQAPPVEPTPPTVSPAVAPTPPTVSPAEEPPSPTATTAVGVRGLGPRKDTAVRSEIGLRPMSSDCRLGNMMLSLHESMICETQIMSPEPLRAMPSTESHDRRDSPSTGPG